MPRKTKKQPEQPARHFSACECGSLRTGWNEISGGQARLYFCMTCSKTWEVSMQTVNTQHGY